MDTNSLVQKLYDQKVPLELAPMLVQKMLEQDTPEPFDPYSPKSRTWMYEYRTPFISLNMYAVHTPGNDPVIFGGDDAKEEAAKYHDAQVYAILQASVKLLQNF
jgi:hypothetical protein